MVAGTVLIRGNNAKIQDLNATYAQSDLSTQFTAWGLQHELLTGIDLAREAKNVYRISAVTKPSTTAGTPNDGTSINESARTTSVSSAFKAENIGVYAQDMLQIAPNWKVLGGLRFDSMRGNFDNVAATGAISSSYNQTIANWSQRVGVLYQPSALSSYHFSYGTSFNTSADTYLYSALGANTDPDSAATALLLSGKRHTSGLEVDLSGRLTPQWEMYVCYMSMPDAVTDVAAPTATAGERQGERPSLTPAHTETVWSTNQITNQLRLGGGINFRSEQSPIRNPGFMAPGFATVDLMAEYKFNDRYVLKGNITNVANTLYADSLYTGHYVPGSGRNVQATLHVEF